MCFNLGGGSSPLPLNNSPNAAGAIPSQSGASSGASDSPTSNGVDNTITGYGFGQTPTVTKSEPSAGTSANPPPNPIFIGQAPVQGSPPSNPILIGQSSTGNAPLAQNPFLNGQQSIYNKLAGTDKTQDAYAKAQKNVFQ